MSDKFIDIEHRRMDRCQAEQLWALAIYAGINGFVVSEKHTFVRAIEPITLIIMLALIGVMVLIFLFERLRGYYDYRNNLAELVKDEPKAPAYLKEKKHMCCPNGLLWIFVFLLAVGVPFYATYKILNKVEPEAISTPSLVPAADAKPGK